MQLRDGATIASSELVTQCGQPSRTLWDSTGSSLYIKFHSDSEITKKGFKASYHMGLFFILSLNDSLAGCYLVITNFLNFFRQNGDHMKDNRNDNVNYTRFLRSSLSTTESFLIFLLFSVVTIHQKFAWWLHSYLVDRLTSNFPLNDWILFPGFYSNFARILTISCKTRHCKNFKVIKCKTGKKPLNVGCHG